MIVEKLAQHLRGRREFHRRRSGLAEGGKHPVRQAVFQVTLFAVLLRFPIAQSAHRVVHHPLFRTAVRHQRRFDLPEKRFARGRAVTVHQLIQKQLNLPVLLLQLGEDIHVAFGIGGRRHGILCLARGGSDCAGQTHGVASFVSAKEQREWETPVPPPG